MSLSEFGIQVKPGLHTFVKVTPQIIRATDSFKKLPLETRECHYQEEHTDDKSLFRLLDNEPVISYLDLSFKLMCLGPTLKALVNLNVS